MARLSKKYAHAALDRAARYLLDARGDDAVVSRKDIRAKLLELEGYEQRLTNMFFRFVDARDYKSGARVTATDIEDTLAYAKEKLIDAYDKNNNGISQGEFAEMSVTGKLAVRLGQELQRAEQGGTADEPQGLKEEIHALGAGLYFPAYGNESDAFLKPFFREGKLQSITKESFREAFGLHPVAPEDTLVYFQTGRVAYQRLFDEYEALDNRGYGNRFRTLEETMHRELRDVTLAIIGTEGSREFPEHPVYFVGLTPAGDILGFETLTVWT
ncbi:MAG: nuclease A inhibitor family protein [Bacteroidota bacterium]